MMLLTKWNTESHTLLRFLWIDVVFKFNNASHCGPRQQPQLWEVMGSVSALNALISVMNQGPIPW